ncbi:hypothetical protein GPUN_0110 [Glaciecola punicea ACAM 611]|uniref:Uncharacterized protein n=1 Tax=Glaciecola punicea ACAM 611 TaxID=1121923 RepID=H5T7I7_9ALTE|nr:hypothetical protein GPUN_0110 [Glaciecola punicea ACAM 611]
MSDGPTSIGAFLLLDVVLSQPVITIAALNRAQQHQLATRLSERGTLLCFVIRDTNCLFFTIICILFSIISRRHNCCIAA